jgi:hypothetical protein
MSTLKVENIHFDAAGTNRIEFDAQTETIKVPNSTLMVGNTDVVSAISNTATSAYDSAVALAIALG